MSNGSPHKGNPYAHSAHRWQNRWNTTTPRSGSSTPWAAAVASGDEKRPRGRHQGTMESDSVKVRREPASCSNAHTCVASAHDHIVRRTTSETWAAPITTCVCYATAHTQQNRGSKPIANTRWEQEEEKHTVKVALTTARPQTNKRGPAWAPHEPVARAKPHDVPAHASAYAHTSAHRPSAHSTHATNAHTATHT